MRKLTDLTKTKEQEVRTGIRTQKFLASILLLKLLDNASHKYDCQIKIHSIAMLLHLTDLYIGNP